MKKINLFIVSFLFILMGCTDEPDVKNNNEPTPEAVATESDIYLAASAEIGRASCRERVCMFV